MVVGAGGVGGSLAALLALAGNVVTCVARGAHKEKMLEQGLRFHSGLKGEQVIPCYAYDGTEVRQGEIGVATAEAYRGRPDLILVCVKGYSIGSVADCISRASDSHTVVLPILNVYGSGPRIARACPGTRVIDGCIYIVGYVPSPGEVVQSGDVCKLVFGARPGDGVSPKELENIRQTLAGAGVKAIVSDDIDRDTFAKWGFISAMAGTGAFFDVPMGAVQKAGKERDLFVGLTRESTALGERLGIRFREDPVTANLRVIDALEPQATSSLQKDLERGHESEIQGQLFDMLDACRKQGVEAPTYERVVGKFRKP